MALQPTKLLLALFMLILVYFTGRTLDFIWGVQAVTDAAPEGYRVFDRLLTQ